MKSLKLFTGLLFIYSCAPTITVNPDIKPSTSPYITPSAIASSSSVTNTDISNAPPLVSSKEISQIKIISEENQVMVEGSFTDNKFNPGIADYRYTNVFNSQVKFTAEVIYKDNSVSKEEILWSISDPDLASIDQNGLVTAKDKKGNTSINISLKSDPTKSLSFEIYVVDNLTEVVTFSGNDCSHLSTNTIVREKYKKRPFLYPIPHFFTSPGDCLTNGPEIAIINGKIYSPDGKPLSGATITVESEDSGVWKGVTQITDDSGAYVFRNVPIELKLVITSAKEGFSTRTRSEIARSNLHGDPSLNVFNFGGTGIDSLYAVQDEPEVISLKVNGQSVTKAAIDDGLQDNQIAKKSLKPTPNQLSDNSNKLPSMVGYFPSLTGINNDNLEIEMVFSEPVNKDDVENNFRVTSQSVFSSTPDQLKPFINGIANSNFPDGESFIIDKNISGSNFIWFDNDTKVIFKTNKPVLTNKDGQEAKYLIDFNQNGFKDKSGKKSLPTKQFRFSSSDINDYAIFSVKNDIADPVLVSIYAKDGGAFSDTLELTFSESLDVVNKSSYAAILSDPTLPLDTSRQLFSREASINKDINNATLLGFLSPVNFNNPETNKFFASYMIAKIISGNLTSSNFKLSALGDPNKTYIATPSKNNLASAIQNDLLLKTIRINDNKVFIELSPNAFQKNDRIILSAGAAISGKYNDIVKSILNKSLEVITDVNDYAYFADPSGRKIDSGDQIIIDSFSVSNQQRVTVVQ